MAQPLLTIGIPTYNRCRLLDGLLGCIFDQLTDAILPDIQIVVSDNHSTDGTRDLVYNYINKGMLIDYSCNDENIGGNNNILKIGNELAKGRYCWVIGDDDLIRKGGISYYLGIIRENQKIGVFYVNHTLEMVEGREAIEMELPVKQANKMCVHGQDELLPNCEEILNYTTQNALFTCVSSFIFKTKIWQDNFIGYQTTDLFSGLTNTFPHSAVLSANLVQNKVYYVDHPYLAFFVGAQNWFSDWELLLSTRVLDLADLFEAKGAGEGFLRTYRERIFKDSFGAYYRFYSNAKLPGWFSISLKNDIKKYFKYPAFRKKLSPLLYFLMKQKVKKIIKWGRVSVN